RQIGEPGVAAERGVGLVEQRDLRAHRVGIVLGLDQRVPRLLGVGPRGLDLVDAAGHALGAAELGERAARAIALEPADRERVGRARLLRSLAEQARARLLPARVPLEDRLLRGVLLHRAVAEQEVRGERARADE